MSNQISPDSTTWIKRMPLARLLALTGMGGALIVLGVLALGYLLWSEAGASGVPGGYESAIPAAVDHPAPKLSLVNLYGQPASLADYAGQVVLVNNWATWCPPCRAEMPILEQYYQDHRPQGFVVIGIESGSPAETVLAEVERSQMTFPIWLDPKVKSVAAFNNRSLPNSYVIDRDGQVRLAWTGPISRTMLEKFVTPLLEE